MIITTSISRLPEACTPPCQGSAGVSWALGTRWPYKRRNGGERETQRHDSPAFLGSHQEGPRDGGPPIACPTSPNLSSMCSAPAASGQFPPLERGQAWVRARAGSLRLAMKAGSCLCRPPSFLPQHCHLNVQSLRYQFFFKYLFSPPSPTP